LSMDYLNRSSANLTGKEIPYNFNNYYTLDIRIKNDKLMVLWEGGEETYDEVFNKYFKNEYTDNLLHKLREEYSKRYEAEESKTELKKGVGANVKMSPIHKDDSEWVSLNQARRNKSVELIYQEIPTVSVYIPTGTDNMGNPRPSGQEKLAIKRDEFIPLIMKGMISASRGHVPQGVTIEEILEGKFSRKAIAPEQGTFINRVKDPTSDKDFSFRSWKDETLEGLHNLIMNTFKRDSKLQMTSDTTGSGVTRSSLFLYMKQEDFQKFEKGGQGFKNLAKSTLDYMQAKAPKLNI